MPLHYTCRAALFEKKFSLSRVDLTNPSDSLMIMQMKCIALMNQR